MMIEQIEERIQKKLRKIPFVDHVSGGPIPLPDESGETRDHLLVNIGYSGHWEQTKAADLLAHCQEIACSTLRIIRHAKSVKGFKSIIVSIFVSPCPGQGRRAYRTGANVSKLSKIDRKNFINIIEGEESHLPEIRELLGQEPIQYKDSGIRG